MGIECVNNLAVTILDDTRNGGVVHRVGREVVHGMGEVVHGMGGVVHGMGEWSTGWGSGPWDGEMVHGFSVNTTSEAVLFPIRMILAASVWEA